MGETVDFVCIDPNNVKHFKTTEPELLVSTLKKITAIQLTAMGTLLEIILKFSSRLDKTQNGRILFGKF